MGKKSMKETTEGTTEKHGFQITSKLISKQAELDTEVAEVSKATSKINWRPFNIRRAKTFHRIDDESTAQIS